MIVLIAGMTLPTWAKLLRKKAPMYGVRHKDVYATAVELYHQSLFQTVFNHGLNVFHR